MDQCLAESASERQCDRNRIRQKKDVVHLPPARNKQRNDYIRPDARLSGGSSPCQLKGYQHHTGRQTDKRMEIMET